MAPCAIKTLISRCYAAQGLRHAFLPAIVSTSGRIHGELLRLLFNLADKKTSKSLHRLQALSEAIDVESEVYCRRRSGDFWRMPLAATLGITSSAALALGLARQRAPVPEHRLLVFWCGRLATDQQLRIHSPPFVRGCGRFATYSVGCVGGSRWGWVLRTKIPCNTHKYGQGHASSRVYYFWCLSWSEKKAGF